MVVARTAAYQFVLGMHTTSKIPQFQMLAISVICCIFARAATDPHTGARSFLSMNRSTQ